MYRSEIRHSTVQGLLEKVRKHKYGEYLLKLNIQKIRGFKNKDISFDFPVTALVGTNGSGKSSILGAAACAYKQIKPGMFFPKSSVGDDSMSDWGITYELIDKRKQDKSTIKRTSYFKRSRWNRDDVIDRHVLFFGIQRTVPAGEKTLFKKLTTSSYKHHDELRKISENIAGQAQKILGKNVTNYEITNYGNDNKFLIGENNGIHYSEFHFGAGESSIIRMIEEIENAPDNSLVLIEEIENGLHPIATARMVEYLIDVAERKSIQSIFTSHSDYALSPLPDEAIWSCRDGDLDQGKLSVESLRAITGRIDKKLAIFVEDKFAKYWVESILRSVISEYYEQLEVHALGGDGTAVKIHKSNLANPASSKRSLCVIDGDSLQEEDNELIWRLPGKQPEREVFDTVYAHSTDLLAKLTVACHLDINQQEYFRSILNEVNHTNRDGHLIFSQIGERIGLISEEIIRSAFFKYWAEFNKEFCEAFVQKVQSIISSPKND